MNGKTVLLAYFKQARWRYMGGFMLLVFTTFLASRIPMQLGLLTDELSGGSYEAVLGQALRLIVLASSVFGLKFLWRLLLMGGGRGLEVWLRNAFFAQLQTLPQSFFQTRHTGDLLARAISDIQALRLIFGPGLLMAFDGILISLFSISSMILSIDPFLTLIALAPLPLAALLILKLRKPLQDRYKKVQENFSDLSTRIQEDLSGVRVIKSFAREAEFSKRLEEKSRKRIDLQLNLTRLQALLAPGVQLCFASSFVLFIIFASPMVQSGAISLGDFIAFNAYTLAIMAPISSLARIVNVWQRGLASYKRLDEIFCQQPDKGTRPLSLPESRSFLKAPGPKKALQKQKTDLQISKMQPGRRALGISIRDLYFTYAGAKDPVLRGLSLELEPGKSLGIVGATGSGKSTLLNLLMKVQKLPANSIFIDGTDLTALDTGSYRERLACVPQDSFLFSTTVRGNIEFFKPEYSEQKIRQASRQAQLDETIQGLPKGFETILGERGITLSGGQKQRLSLARALVREADALFLDDCFSAVDTETERKILENILPHFEGRTVILISSRVSSLKFLDYIAYLKDGKIMEFGSPEDLMKNDGPFARLVQAQTRSFEFEENGELGFLQEDSL